MADGQEDNQFEGQEAHDGQERKSINVELGATPLAVEEETTAKVVADNLRYKEVEENEEVIADGNNYAEEEQVRESENIQPAILRSQQREPL